MLALRSFQGPDELPEPYRNAISKPSAVDWLSMQKAACELDVSVSTLRRMIRKGRIRNRIVPKRGGFAYLIYLPNSRHARLLNGDNHDSAKATLSLVPRTVDEDQTSPEMMPTISRDDEIRALRSQVQRLSEALARALRMKQRSLPTGIGDPSADPVDPYGRYRWLARKHRWWPF